MMTEFLSSGAARYLGVSVEMLRKWANEGALQCRRNPVGHRVFDQDELDRFQRDRLARLAIRLATKVGRDA